jgi:hypothetical protein
VQFRKSFYNQLKFIKMRETKVLVGLSLAALRKKKEVKIPKIPIKKCASTAKLILNIQ